MIIFLPIKPNYAYRIINKTKKFEFRKRIFRKKITFAIIYASNPEKKILGLFKIDRMLIDEPKNIWKLCNRKSGISEYSFKEYYKGSRKAVALKISSIYIFKRFRNPLEIWEDFKVPQSFRYINKKEYDKLINVEPKLSNWVKKTIS